MTENPLPPFVSLGDLVERLAARDPADRALVAAGKIFQREEVAVRARMLAARWHAAGLTAGQTVGIIGDTGPAVVLALLSASRAGLLPLLLDPRLSPSEAAFVIGRAEPRALARCAGSSLAATFSGPIFEFDDAGEATIPAVPAGARLPAPVADPAAPAVLIVTSGTSGRPQIVSLSARNLSSNLQSAHAVHTGDRTDVVLSLLPLTHAFELTAGLLGPLCAGASVVFPASRNPHRLLQAMQSERVTRINVVPAILQMLHAEVRDTAAGFVSAALLKRHLRAIVCGGAAPAPELVARLVRAGAPLWVGYGLTEASPVVTLGRAADLPAGSAGRALPDVELRIEPGTGELLVRGPNVMAGYHRDPDATASVLKDGWLHTGDLARIDDRGYVFLLGRLRDLIVTGGGLKLVPDDIEAAYQSACFAELCAVGVPDAESGGESAYLVAVPAEGMDDQVVTAEFRRLRALADPRRAARLAIRRAPLPRTRTLKVRRDLVRQAVVTEQEVDHVRT